VRSTNPIYSLFSVFHSLLPRISEAQTVFRNTLLSNTLSLRSYLSVRDQVSHPDKTTRKIIFLYTSCRQQSEVFRNKQISMFARMDKSSRTGTWDL